MTSAPPEGLLCPAPFMVMDFAPEGNVHACCVNAAYPLGNVRFQTLREIWDGGRAQALRAAMARHDYGYGCGSCRHREALGTGEADLTYYRHNPAPRSVEWPELMAFGLHNTCNLACVMCGGNLSSRLRALEGRPRLEPAYGDRFFAELVEFLPHLRRAEFRGGEPFLVREHYRIFDLLIELGAGVETGLQTQVTTNGTIWNDRVESVLDALAMQVTFSIDGVSEATNTAIRVGSDHADVLVNLDRFAAHARARGTRLDLSFCVLRHNWRELGDLLRLADRLGVEGHPQLVLDPEHGLQRLPTDELREILGRLEAQTAALDSHLDLEVNRTAWKKMLGWLDAELRQRSRGTPLRLWEPPGPETVTHALSVRIHAGREQALTDSSAREVVARCRRDLGAWSSNGEVAEIVTDADDRVVRAQLGMLAPDGVPPLSDITGDHFADAFLRLVHLLGPHLWVVDEFVESGLVDQTLLLAPSALRDKSGLLVRSTSVPAANGGVHTLLAIDTYYWTPAPSSVAVALPIV